MIYSTIAVVIFVVLLVLFFPGDREYQRIPYDVVFLGDSVYGLCRDETSIAAKLQEKTGLKCYNGGLGGTVLGRADAERRLGYTKDSLSAAGLVRSFAVKDFGVQKTIRIRDKYRHPEAFHKLPPYLSKAVRYLPACHTAFP